MQRHEPLTKCNTLLEAILLWGQHVAAVLEGAKCRLEKRGRDVLISLAAELVGMWLPARLDQSHFGKGDLETEEPTGGVRAGAQPAPLHQRPLSHY